jgi:hypothetical protein
MREGAMKVRTALALLLTVFLAACGSMRCDEQSAGHRTAGECGIFSKF